MESEYFTLYQIEQIDDRELAEYFPKLPGETDKEHKLRVIEMWCPNIIKDSGGYFLSYYNLSDRELEDRVKNISRSPYLTRVGAVLLLVSRAYGIDELIQYFKLYDANMLLDIYNNSQYETRGLISRAMYKSVNRMELLDEVLKEESDITNFYEFYDVYLSSSMIDGNIEVFETIVEKLVDTVGTDRDDLFDNIIKNSVVFNDDGDNEVTDRYINFLLDYAYSINPDDAVLIYYAKVLESIIGWFEGMSSDKGTLRKLLDILFNHVKSKGYTVDDVIRKFISDYLYIDGRDINDTIYIELLRLGGSFGEVGSLAAHNNNIEILEWLGTEDV